MTAYQDTSGRLLAERYRLVSELGRGGMGTVWRAVDEILGRPVAVKELRFAAGMDEDERRRLIARTLTEAKAIARVRHTAAITVYDVVEEDDRPWIVMELVESRSLSEVIATDGVLPPKRAAEIGLELLAVLSQAHRSGILHRDVKPSNVLIGHDGRVVLTDFGIARVEGDPSVTSTGMLVGAPSYISPERARGRIPGAPSDLWSLGATLYAMVEGRPPYDKGSALSTLTAVMTEELTPPANGGPLVPVIAGLLRKDPQERFDENTARHLLLQVLNQDDSSPQPAQPPAPSAAQQAAGPSARPPFGAAPATAADGPAYPGGARPRDPFPAPGPAPRPRSQSATAAMPMPGTGFEPLPTTESVTVLGTRSGRRAARLLVALLVLLVVAGGGVWVAMAQQDKPNTPLPGYERVAMPGGATIEIPQGWTLTRLSAEHWRYRGPSGYLDVAWTGTPGSSAVAALRTEESRTAASYPHYHRVDLQKVGYRGWDAADWEWTYTGGDGSALRSLDRGFATDGHHGYTIDWTSAAAGWGGARNHELMNAFFSSFQPAT
ncbi:serine/threonine protein kinase [Streptacidiphilus sp. PB12-B1b]|uniref:serine/threonine-protein kinase n=1 Tax=Streptacidiphilus sp. PB12-B1b TaxID=2705012 RepID=UPI0015FDAD15|nr:serine/threonine-protein kinase [Streptacidiphilus sp. PB12-B1b]QMU79282.1 serine/threonine protein kinase [Streptacidiphilus sp. PB12-B1b]